MNTPKPCEYCGQLFGKRLRIEVYTRQRFCSPTCRNQARPRTPIAVCPTCGTEFEAISTGKGQPRKRFCSAQCATGLTLSDKELILFLYPLYGADAVASMLDVDRDKVQSLANKNHVKLTTETNKRLVHEKAREYMSANNPMKSADAREKVRQYWLSHPDHMATVMAHMRTESRQYQKNKPSKLEQKLRLYLEELGVEYEPSAIIKDKFIVDIRIGNLILEADGDWWHGHPRFAPLNERQLKQKVRDASRNKYLTACGYTVIRIWESDMSLDLVRQIVSGHGVIG